MPGAEEGHRYWRFVSSGAGDEELIDSDLELLRRIDPDEAAEAGVEELSAGRSRKVAKVKVDGSVDRRKRELGDRAERWALAAMINGLKDLDADSRGEAIDALLQAFEPFQGEPAEAARAHAEAARARDLEDDELIEELAGFLHVAGHSDAFGFDMLGWIAHPGSGEHEALLVEVKSSVDGSFHLSPNEWTCAEDFASDYSVLVVRRATTSAVPQRLDLLVDPARLVADKQLSQTPDGYLIAYVAES